MQRQLDILPLEINELNNIYTVVIFGKSKKSSEISKNPREYTAQLMSLFTQLPRLHVIKSQR